MCGPSQGQLQRDHTVPVSLGSDGAGTLLCKSCHLDKTNAEQTQHAHARAKSLNPLLSWFNPKTYEDFILNNKPLAIVRQENPPIQKGLP